VFLATLGEATFRANAGYSIAIDGIYDNTNETALGFAK
jgi:hypothetical protein